MLSRMTLALGLAISGVCHSAPPSEAMMKKLAAAIREKCPDAEIEVTKEEFIARHGTMKFTVHSRSKTGEISSSTYEREGPNYKGFLLRVSMNSGRYQGAAVVPQTLQEPYYPIFLDAPSTEDGEGHYFVRFAYGSRLDPELKKAIEAAVPRSRFGQVNRVGTAP